MSQDKLYDNKAAEKYHSSSFLYIKRVGYIKFGTVLVQSILSQTSNIITWGCY